MFKKFWNDESGVIISAELVLVLSIAVLTMVVGLAEVASAQAKGAEVRYIGWVGALMSWHKSRHREPLQIGTSISHHLNTAGTIGGLVRKPDDKEFLGS